MFELFVYSKLNRNSKFKISVNARMSIQTELSEFKKRIDGEMGVYFDEMIAEAKKEDAFSAQLLVRVKKFVLAGGKRLRGALLYYGYLMAGGTDTKAILRACMGIELVHSFFLVHDDIMDRDEIRHGVDTMHRDFEKIGKRFFPKKDSNHFGTSMAITAGDLLGSMGSQCIFSSKFPADRIVLALNSLQGSISRTVLGQAMDIHMEYRGQAQEKQILAMYTNKTARYTFESPLHLGGILGGAKEGLLKNFSAYALPLGIAFQLQDDILGVFGESRKTGKSVGADIVEGKMTLLMVRALEMADRSEKKILEKCVSHPESVSQKEVALVQEIFRRSGALAYTQELAGAHLAEGVRIAKKLPDTNAEAKEFLLGLAEYLREREV